MKKPFLFIIVALLLQLYNTAAFAQSNVSIDSLVYYIRTAQDENELAPLSTSDPNYKEPDAELTILFKINNYKELKYVDILFGTERTKKDVKEFRLLYIEENGQSYLTFNSTNYPIINSQVIIRQRVPGSLFYKKIYLRVFAYDKDEKRGNSLSKEFN